jgi:hypothetical protein
VESWAIIRFSDIGAKQSVRFTCGVREACAEIQMVMSHTLSFIQLTLTITCDTSDFDINMIGY